MRSLRFRDNSHEATFDLNLAPMMDMLVSIIPFMLLSATFMQIMLINIPLPAPVAQALAQDRANNEREVSIRVNMDGKAGFLLEVTDLNGKSVKTAVPKTGAEYDYKTLHTKLVEVKQRFPKVFRLDLNPDEAVDYKSIVKVMDSSRDMENADPKILIDNAVTPLLFPDVVLANLMG
jgi:biopolymer transport protein ExbD